MTKLYENDAYQVFHFPYLPENARVFLNQIQWGNKGTRYRRPVTREGASRLHRPWAFVIQTQHEVVGTVLANQYTFLPKMDGYYFRYFASHPQSRGQVFLGINARRVLKWLESRVSSHDFFYAYLEKKNEPSLRMVRHVGFQPYQTSLTLGFSRFFPKKDPRVYRVRNVDEQTEISVLLQNHYQDHAFVHPIGWHYQSQYFVIREKDTVIAGLQVIPARWEITQMEGKLGSFLVQYGQYLPWVNRILNPSSFQFLGFEGIYVAPGREQDLLQLMEHTLALYRVHAALFWQDPTSPYFLGDRTDLGLLNQLVKGTGSFLMAKNMPEDWKTKPAYISCFDFV